MLARPKSVFLSLKETAAIVGCSLRTLQRYQRQGRLRFVQRGRLKYCLQEDVDRLLAGGRNDAMSIRLDGVDAPSWTARKWFATWVEFRREIDRDDGVALRHDEILAAVDQTFGVAKMAEVAVADLERLLHVTATRLGSGRLPHSWQVALGSRTPVDLDLIAIMPAAMLLVDARRLLRRALQGVAGSSSASSGSPNRSEHRVAK